MLSDGKQARVAAKEISNKVSDVGVKIENVGQDVGDKLQSVDEQVRVIIDGARGMSNQSLISSNIHTFRRQTRKRSGT